MTIAIGLTGGIAAGKSLATAYFLRQQIPVIDADAISRSLTRPMAPGSVAIGKFFGPDFLDAEGAMDRRKMREHAFNHPDALLRLERLLHPLIREEVLHQFQFLESKATPLVVYDCPLLYKPQLAPSWLSRILVIDASDSTRLARLIQRPHINREIALKIMAAQPPRRQLLALAHDVIVNEDTVEAFEKHLHTLLQFYLSRPCDNLK